MKHVSDSPRFRFATFQIRHVSESPRFRVAAFQIRHITPYHVTAKPHPRAEKTSINQEISLQKRSVRK
jgi:hypothetical protein